MRDDPRTQVPAFKKIGTYLPMLAILGIGLPILIYLTVMQTLGWRVPAFGANGVMAAFVSGSDNTVLYASPTTRDYFARSGGNHETLLVPWRNYFSSRKIAFKELRDPARIRDLENGVLILPSAVALSEAERNEILAFRARGGAVLASWATGVRNGKGEWEGWQFLEQLGARVTGEIPSTAELGHLVLNGESPVSHQLPAGQRFGITRTSEPMLRAKGEQIAARFMNWARISDPERRDEGAIVYAEPKPDLGRTVFYAFSESVWESRPLMMYQVIDDSIQWLRREPAFIRGAWSHAKRAAQVIEMDTEDGFPNALVFASMMKAIDYRPTFYVLTSVGRRFPDVLSRLERDFELGYHADVHDGFKSQTAKLQEQRLQIMRAEMGTVVADPSGITGFRAPLESYDATTEQLLRKSGIRHHAADPARSEARLPFIAKLEGVKPEDSLVVLPRTQRDDIFFGSQNFGIEQTASALIADFDLAVENGALALLSVHSQNFYPDSILTKAMPAFLERLKQRRDQVWLAPAGEIAAWWQERERFKLSSVKRGKQLEFDITITGEKPVSGATVIVTVPQKGAQPAVQSTKIGLPKPRVSMIDDYRAAIVFDSLPPGNYAYQAYFSGGS